MSCIRELGALEEAGKLIGRPPFGYVSAGEKYDHYLAPTDDGRLYVPLIYRHCLEGWSLGTIVEWLIAEKVKPVSGSWGERSVAGLIKNPVYRGHRCKRETVPPDETEERGGKVIRYRYGSTWVETPRWQYGKTIHRCEPLVDTAIWKRANEALTTRTKRGHVAPETRAMLAEALFCPFCEASPMYRHRARGRNHAYLYYRCAGRGRQRNSCGNMIRMDLVDAAVNEIMVNTFDLPVMRHEIVYGNEAEIEAEIKHIKFELKQLAAKELDWEEEDRERARLRTEHDRVANTKMVEDRVELVETDDTYRELWEQLSSPLRGPWLAEHGFRVTASKERVIVSQGVVRGEMLLDGPQRAAAVRDAEPVYQGKCGCGCGTDLYGSRYGSPKKFVDRVHAGKAAYLCRAEAHEE